MRHGGLLGGRPPACHVTDASRVRIRRILRRQRRRTAAYRALTASWSYLGAAAAFYTAIAADARPNPFWWQTADLVLVALLSVGTAKAGNR